MASQKLNCLSNAEYQSILHFLLPQCLLKTCENLWLGSEKSVKTIHALKMNYYNEIRK